MSTPSAPNESDALPFSVRIWGARGSMSSSAPDQLRYGGNTACVEVRCGKEILIFDAGSGLRLLGNHLMETGETEKLNLFFTHCHYDHISGLPFFSPFFSPQTCIGIWSGHLPGPDKTLRMIQDYMSPPFFPVGPEVFSAQTSFHDFEPGDALDGVSNVRITTIELNHHDGCVGYRVDYAGRSFCYITDTAHVPGIIDAELVTFVSGADLMIYDAMYTDAEFPHFADFGHSTWEEGIRICQAARIPRYCTFHHRPSRTDAVLDQIEDQARALMPGAFVGREGLVIDL